MNSMGEFSGACEKPETIIGISFGNSNSSIAYTTSENKVEVITNEDGDRQIPSVISYVDGEEYSGQQAKQQLIRNGDNTVAYFRDFLGQDYKNIDSTHCQASAHPREHERTIAFNIKDKVGDEKSIVSVSEITTRHLRRLVSSASEYIGKPVDAAVITIPTDFSKQQEEALIEAANNAKLSVLQLIHEPVAALLAYDSQPDTKLTDKNVVVADLGGTRSDVAVISSRAGIYTILATTHDRNFAGVHLDRVLEDHFAKAFIKYNGEDADPRGNARSMAKLKLESEATKKALSIGTNATFSVESLNIGVDFSATVNRLRYETNARKILEGFNNLIISAVEKAGLDVLEIDEVILSGGTSHTPRIAANMRNIFTSPKTSILAPSTYSSAINPSELQARGASVQASLIKTLYAESMLIRSDSAYKTAGHLQKAIGVLSISDECSKGIFTQIIPSETSIPVRRSVKIATPKEGGDVLIKIVEADSHIKISKPEHQKKPEKKELNDEDSDFDSEEEEEEIREIVWQIGKVLAEAAIKGVKKGGKVDISITIGRDLTTTITCREDDAESVLVRGSLQGT
ncbi:Ribosome-associated complex subunit SSZ1 [Golovinomyces cichoracearum]|uniref:Ribosome-associated complex subunit SSZ1 n=1 Tax=Golovinomyces cichoracearum TaxID=62708 RepID=A0A420HQ96_9PEZI|nr:Ribosome-associated complex subunit SSZ1 [Golovinomyces cichoracearum]